MKNMLLAAALALASAAVLAQDDRGGRREHELIFGAELMTSKERQAYRGSLEAAKGAEAQARVRERHRERLRERARLRGVELAEPEGVVKRKPQ